MVIFTCSYQISNVMYDLTLPVKESHSSVVMEPPGDYGERFVNPLSDFGFKRIFGNASNKRILKSFVNAVLNGEHVIRDIKLSPTVVVGAVGEAKTVIFDLMCMGERDRKSTRLNSSH